MAAPTNSRHAVAHTVANAPASPVSDVCGSAGCTHGQAHHGTSGTCRFVASCNCKGFTPREQN